MKKNIFLYIFLFTFLFATLPSCEIGNDEEEFGEEEFGDDVLNLSKKTISAKWDPSDNSIYESIEFNEEGQYFIIEKAQEERSTKNRTNTALGMLRSADGSNSVYCGTYEIVDDITIELSNYGTMEVYEITSEKVDASILKDEYGYWIDFIGDKQPQMSDSQYIDVLCRAWYLPYEDIDFVIFQKSGTYYTIMEDEGEYYYDFGTWAWNQGETAFTMWYAEPPSLFGVCECSISALASTHMRLNAHDVTHVDGETYTENYTMEFIAVEKIEFPKPPIKPETGPDDEPGPGPGPDPEPGITYPTGFLGTWECTFNIGFTKVDGEIDQGSIEQNNKVGTKYTFNIDGTIEQSHTFVGNWFYENNILTITGIDEYPVEYSILTLDNGRLVIECDMLLDLDSSKQVSIYEKMIFKKVLD